jgi:hypothetical protein
MIDLTMPCFWPGNAEKEGIIIGRLLTGYGELEFGMCKCLALTIPGESNEALNKAVKLLFQTRGEERRIKTADKAMKAPFRAVGLGQAYDETIDDMHWCRKIRNQYSHCHWLYTDSDGLHFINLEDWAKLPSPPPTLTAGRLPVSISLLAELGNLF